MRQLPSEVQQVILSYAEQLAASARDKIADELLGCREEADRLADENERLMAELEDMRTLFSQAVSDKAVAEGRAAQLASELVVVREQVTVERAAAEQARTALANAELRLQLAGSLGEELRQTRAERDASARPAPKPIGMWRCSARS